MISATWAECEPVNKYGLRVSCHIVDKGNESLEGIVLHDEAEPHNAIMVKTKANVQALIKRLEELAKELNK